MSTVSIFVFRHGQSTFNRDNRLTGFHNPPLTKAGKEDAKIIAERLKDKKIQLAFQTSLKRSQQTLKEVLVHHPECSKILTDDRMIERSYGSIAGKTHWQIIKENGLTNYEKWHRGFHSRPPNGESFADVEKRVKAFIKDLITIAKKEKINIAVAAHGNSIRLLKKVMEKASENQALQWRIPYDNYLEYKIHV
jgi:broad specificity phosphatase PhoE